MVVGDGGVYIPSPSTVSLYLPTPSPALQMS